MSSLSIARCAPDPLEASLILAREICERSPDAVAAAKKLFQDTYAGASEREALELETKLQKKLIASWNQVRTYDILALTI